MSPLDRMLTEAIACHGAGQLKSAAGLYRQVLALEPQHPQALHLLGVVATQSGSPAAAVELISRALQSQPDQPELLASLGEAQLALGLASVAISNLSRAVALQPESPAWSLRLGNALVRCQRLPEAADAFQRACALDPSLMEAYLHLGNVWKLLGRLTEARAAFHQVVALAPNSAAGHNNLGLTLAAQGDCIAALGAYQRALKHSPESAEIRNNLGNAWLALGRTDDAIASFRGALERHATSADAWSNLGNAHWQRHELPEAHTALRRALELRPGLVAAWRNLGNVLKDQGALLDAVASFRRAVELAPDNSAAHSDLCYTLHFCEGVSPRELADAHRLWNERHALPLTASAPSHPRPGPEDRRLRVGYVSPDFRRHPVGRFILPLLERHDRSRFDIYCYSDVRRPDDTTERCRAAAGTWRSVVGMSDADLAGLIRQDRIDVLIDLTMHMGNNRLLTFARKPAPVQITYLAYCSTTGLSAMDFRLTDPWLDPVGSDESIYSESSLRLPHSYWCYEPSRLAGPVARRAARPAGQVTFGCLNNYCKVTHSAWEAWGRVLRAVPGARLLVHTHPGPHRNRARESLGQFGVAPDRLEFVGFASNEEYFRQYDRIDVALDPFPYGGGTTTCDALWMGVPVISLAGRSAVGRAGLSLLANVGLPELIANSADDYVRIAAELAGAPDRLNSLRATLRDRVQESPLMNADQFARDVEAAFRHAWATTSGDS